MVAITCNDPAPAKSCSLKKYAAYTWQPKDESGKLLLKYPVINYCPEFFSILKSHDEKVREIEADGSGDKKKNVLNLRSRGRNPKYFAHNNVATGGITRY